MRLPVARDEPRAKDEVVEAAGDCADAVEVLGRQAAEDLLHDVIAK